MAEAKAGTKSTAKKTATTAPSKAVTAAKGVAKKAVAPKAAAPAKKAAPKRARKSGNGEGGKVTVSPEQRYRMIAEAAYYHAERRGFVGGDCAQDWIDAEAEIDSILSKM